MNQLHLLGNHVKDPEMKGSIVLFKLAVQRKFKNRETGKYESDFFDCKAFGKTAEIIANNFAKGNKMACDAHLQNNNYTKKDGTKVYSNDIIVDNIYFVESKNNVAKKPYEAKKEMPDFDSDPFEDNSDSIDDSDLPFD